MRKRYFAVLFVFVALASISTFAADPIVLKIPCGSAPWLSCAELTTKLVEGAATEVFPGGMKAVIREMLDDAYLMNVRLAKNLVSQPECTTFDNMNKPPLCPPLKIPENGCVDEISKSYKTPAGVSPVCPPISLVGAATNDHPLFSLGKAEVGTRESANVAGGLLLALSNQGAEVTAEVAKNVLTIAPTSPCHSRASSLADLIAAQSDVKLIERVNACDPNDQTQACSARNYFNANLSTILSAYLQLARCRISDESTKKFVAFTMDAGSPPKSYTTLLSDLYSQQCFYPYRGNPAAMRWCYARKYEAWIKARARAAFPLVAAGCP